ncbi:BLIP family protein [Streptomyces sp. NPDC018610]|uniref:BLIP family protein n=1 Tax=Streptomyces sp. NPDC018610 TaxID=3365049 RepID=UPI0037AEA66C
MTLRKTRSTVSAGARTLALAAAAAGLVVSAAGTSSAAYSGMTGAKFQQVQFGMTRQQVLDIVGPGACETGGFWGTSLQCWQSQSGDFNPYATFDFTSGDKVNGKAQEFLFKPVAPALTLAKFNSVVLKRTTLSQFKDLVGAANSCVPFWERYPDYPSTSTSDIAYRCFAPGYSEITGRGVAQFFFDNGVASDKVQSGLS